MKPRRTAQEQLTPEGHPLTSQRGRAPDVGQVVAVAVDDLPFAVLAVIEGVARTVFGSAAAAGLKVTGLDQPGSDTHG
jgi:hypothetical protein